MPADELHAYTPGLNEEFTKNQITQVNHINIDNSFWKPAYKYFCAPNLSIEKLRQSHELSGSLKNQLIGEAKFIRAFFFFQLDTIKEIQYPTILMFLTKYFILPNSTKNNIKSLYKKQVYHAEISNAVSFYFIGGMYFRATEPGKMEL